MAKKSVPANMKSGTREFPRKILRCAAKIAPVGTESFNGRTLDVSLGGISIVAAMPLNTGQQCTVAFTAPLSGKVVSVAANVEVVYSIPSGEGGFRIGLQFVEIDPVSNRTLAELMI